MNVAAAREETMIAKKRTEILFMTLTMIFVLVGSALAEGEWATNGADIHSTNSGNVGIGITNPQAKQHNQIEARSTAFDAGDGVTWHDLVIQNPDNTRNAAVGLAFELNRTYHTNAGTGIAAVKSIASDDYGADMIFVTRPHRAVAKERIRITSDGNVGIGTHAPKAKQHNLIEDRSTAFDAADGGTWHDLVIQNPNSTQNAAVGLAFELNRTYHTNAGTGIAAVKSTTSDDYGADMIFVTRPHRAVARERIRITSDGNVGIGTTNPQSKLSVEGTITAKEVKVTETGWSDFVFEDKFELPSLNSVESYITEHKHLPDIPSAKDIKERGLVMSEILAKQMQKIEELTLYLINIKKENDDLKAKLKRQNKILSELKELRKRIEALEMRN